MTLTIEQLKAAYAAGKVIQIKLNLLAGERWVDMKMKPKFDGIASDYRIKPEEIEQ